MAIGKLIGKVIPKKEVAKRLQARPKTTTKKKKSTNTTPKAAKMVQGAGDKSDPGVGKFRAGQKQARGGATKSAGEAISTKERDKLIRDKAARDSFERSKKLTGIKKLEDEYDKLTPSAKRAQRVKGTKSKYYDVFKKRGMKPMKKGGPIGSTTKPKERPVDGIKMAAEQPSWMKGLTQGEIDAILGRPTRDSSGVKRSDKKKKKKKVITAKEGRKVLKSVDQTKNPGLAKLPTKVRNNMGFAKKGGKVSYRKGGGQALVASLYD